MTKKTPLPPLTPKEKLVLEFIENHVLSSGVSPSYQEIKDHFGLASFNSVQNHRTKNMRTVRSGHVDRVTDTNAHHRPIRHGPFK